LANAGLFDIGSRQDSDLLNQQENGHVKGDQNTRYRDHLSRFRISGIRAKSAAV
jgi:hypothetical protein